MTTSIPRPCTGHQSFMVFLRHGWGQTMLSLSGQCRYTPELVFQQIQAKRRPYWIEAGDSTIHIADDDVGALWLAVQVVVAYHNALVHSDDGFNQRISEAEERVKAHLEDPSESSEDETKLVFSEDDMVYEREAYPSCVKCVWEVYDVNAAGCLKCGANHVCYSNAVDNCCPLETCDDHSRVCTITGQVLREVRHAQNEFLDTAIMTREDETSNSGASSFDIEAEVHSTVYKLLQGELAIKYRDEENTRQAKKIATTLHKALRQAKMRGLDGLPNVCTFVAEVMNAERNIRFIQEASDDLAEQCTKRIIVCLMNLKGKGVKITSGARIQSLTCGLLYLLRTGLVYGNSILIASIEEISACIPHENKLEAYFGISSKVICETENEIKLVFREHYQK